MNFKICAVIVTQNRRALLEKCVHALRAQSYPLSSILIVDNASTDDTPTWLATQTDLQSITQANGGGGGGFHTGLCAALANDCEWVWCMDDDVLPEPNALEMHARAIHARPDARVFNSLVVGTSNRQRPTAGALCARTDAANFLRGEFLYSTTEILARADANGLLDSAGGQFYLGTLLHRSVIEKVGAPLPWLFIRGDEIEYALRIMRAGYHIWTVTQSIVTHPDTRIEYLDVLGKKLPCETMSALKRYYSIRNSIYIRQVYYEGQPFAPYIARRILGALLTELLMNHETSWREKINCCDAALRGARDGLALSANPTRAAQNVYAR